MGINWRRVLWCVCFFYIFWGGQQAWQGLRPDPCHAMKPWLCEP